MEYAKKPAGKEMFKPCKGCPTPGKCMKAKKCMKDRPTSKLVEAMGMKK